MLDEARLCREAERIYLRYAAEVVEAFGLCPWAAQARADGRVRVQALLGEPELGKTLASWHALETDETVDIALLLFPQATLGRRDFAHFASELQAADAADKPPGATLFAVAEFHPDVTPDFRSAERLVPYVRRSPDPTLQLVRRRALDAVRLGPDHGTRFVDVAKLLDPSQLPSEHEPLAKRIARANLATLERVGADRLDAITADILRDRAESYEALGIAHPPWWKPESKRA
jgi:hypothetical protein